MKILFYDLCNTLAGDRKNYQQILFKRFPIMNPQVYPKKGYPPDTMNQFIRLTNVYDDEDNKLLAEVYLVSLLLPV